MNVPAKHESCKEQCSLTPPASTICDTAGCQKQQIIADVFTPSPLMVRFFRDWKPR